MSQPSPAAPLLSDAQAWADLDACIRNWWDGDVHTALEEDLRKDPDRTLLHLPHPYTTPGGSEKAFPEIYGWDTYYINCALLAHGRTDLVKNNIRNQLYQIDRFGMTLNGNRTWYETRSQPPLWVEGLMRYVEATGDEDLMMQAYPLFKQEYLGYWTAPHHQTSIGLSTNRDIGDTNAPRLHAESETGLDFFSGFDGDVRQCVPLILNCILVNVTRNLAAMARQLGRDEEAGRWDQETDQRTQRIRKYCWNPDHGFFFEYNFKQARQTSVWSLCAYWTLWARVATDGQAALLATHLGKFLHPHGLAMTDRSYPSPHPEFSWLQWDHPSGWPPYQIMVAEALGAYGYDAEARTVARNFLQLQLRLHGETGKLWEKYNVVEGSLNFPKERYEVPPLHGWSSASVVLLGRFLRSTDGQAHS